MTVRVDVNAAIAPRASDGVEPAAIDDLAPRAEGVMRELAARRQAGELAFAELPHDRAELQRVRKLAAEVRAEADVLVVLGIGGSALGARALAGALRLPPEAGSAGRRLIVADNIDPSTFGALLERLDLSRTVFNVVSKSGETAETMSQFLVVREKLLRELGAVDYKRHLVITTDAERGFLRQIVHDEGFRDLTVPAKVGGRFSVLSAVGLFPAAVAGIDIEELLAGAAWMDERCREQSLAANPACLHAAVRYLLHQRGRTVAVLMPYSDRLSAFGEWFCQLWAESLGKEVNRSGEKVEFGETPVRALGAVDQHSQLQLYLEGPRDKLVTFVRVEDHGKSVPVPRGYGDLDGVGYLGDHTLGELLNAELQATELALAKRGRPSTTIVVPAINAFTVGQLLFLLEMETVIMAGLAGVDPFGQPGVEEGKRLTCALMGRPGYEAEREEIERWQAARDPRYVA